MYIALQQHSLQSRDGQRRLRCVAPLGFAHSRTSRPKQLDTHCRPRTQAPVQEQEAVGVHVEAAAAVMLGQCTQRYVHRTPTVRVAEAARMAFGVSGDEDVDESAGVVHAADED